MINAIPLMLMLAGAPGPAIESTVSPPADSKTVDVWMMPIGSAALAVLGAAAGEAIVYVPLGVGFHVRDIQFGVELSSLYRKRATVDSFALGVAIGPVLHLNGHGWLDGFYVEPKLQFDVGTYTFKGRWVFWAGSVTVDVGYQIRWKSLYAALVVGAGLGHGWTPSNRVGVTMFPETDPYSNTVLSLNLNLLKLGFTF